MADYTLDRRIEIQRRTGAVNDYNEPTETWATYATLWTSRIDASAGETYRAQEVGSSITCHFVVRSTAITRAITPADRIYESVTGLTYNIVGTREVERNAWMEIHGVARND
jgi:SPP1 family predicted phage head-tail adaptor